MGADNFATAAAVITAILLIALIVGARHVNARDEQRDENFISGTLVVLTIVGVAAVLLAAVSGPHPS